MEGSDDFSNDDIWSDSLREELFSDYNLGPSWDNNANDLFLPRLSFPNSNALDHPTPPEQPWGINTGAPNSSLANSQNTASETRKRSHLDLPNFPLAANPTAASSNSSGRPPPLPSTHVPQSPQPTATPAPTRELLYPPPPSALDSDLSDSDTSLTDSDRSNTPWPDTDEDNLERFVDLTGGSSPPAMPPSRRPASRRIITPQRRNALRHGSLSEYLSDRPSNPAKRRKTGTISSQSSQRPPKIEGIDLTGVDDDRGLSKVLEHQRMATIKAQQEQASKPVKLSTLQCIICMENMKDLSATSCGHLFCHSCLMEALIAGENQGVEPGKGIPKCPVCRKKVVRPLPTDKRSNKHDVVPLAIKLKARSEAGKGKGRAVD